MTDAFDRAKAAIAHRYALEREIGSGGMATVFLAIAAHLTHPHILPLHDSVRLVSIGYGARSPEPRVPLRV
jgi:hypothetical protein